MTWRSNFLQSKDRSQAEKFYRWKLGHKASINLIARRIIIDRLQFRGHRDNRDVYMRNNVIACAGLETWKLFRALPTVKSSAWQEFATRARKSYHSGYVYVPMYVHCMYVHCMYIHTYVSLSIVRRVRCVARAAATEFTASRRVT